MVGSAEIDTGTVVTVPLCSVFVDPRVNARKTFDDKQIDELAESIRKHGLLHFPSVRDVTNLKTEDQEFNIIVGEAKVRAKQLGHEPKAYMIVVGERRFRALSKLQVTTATFRLVGENAFDAKKAPHTDPATRVLNVVENVRRQELAHFELADAFVEMRVLGMTAAEIGQRIGITKNYVLALMRCKEKLSPTLQRVFRGQGGKASIQTLIQLASYDSHEEQDREWEKILVLKERKKAGKLLERSMGDEGVTEEAPEPTSSEEGEKKKFPRVVVSAKSALDLLQRLPSARVPDKVGSREVRSKVDFLLGFREAMRYMLGQRKSPPVTLDEAE